MLVLLSIVGVAIGLTALSFGWFVGEMDRIEKDPEVIAERKRQKEERKRIEEWKAKWGKRDD
jgi:hypothetical protein